MRFRRLIFYSYVSDAFKHSQRQITAKTDLTVLELNQRLAKIWKIVHKRVETEVDLYLTFISCLQKYLQNLDYCWCLMYDCIMINHQIFASSQCIPSLTCLLLQMLQKLFHTSTGRKNRIKNLSRETP